jgi:hypothetical protein
VPVPSRSLAGVRRVFLKPGEKQKITFRIAAEQMSVITDAGKRVVEPASSHSALEASNGFTALGRRQHRIVNADSQYPAESPKFLAMI